MIVPKPMARLLRRLIIISALVATAAVIVYYLALPFVYEFDGLFYLPRIA